MVKQQITLTSSASSLKSIPSLGFNDPAAQDGTESVLVTNLVKENTESPTTSPEKKFPVEITIVPEVKFTPESSTPTGPDKKLFYKMQFNKADAKDFIPKVDSIIKPLIYETTGGWKVIIQEAEVSM